MQNINFHIGPYLDSSSSPFKGLNQKEKEEIVHHHTLTKIKKGGYLFREGEKAHGPVILVNGKAKLFRVGIAGREHIIKMLNDNDLAGLQNLFTESKWSASAVAVEDSLICTLGKQCLVRIIRNNADMSMLISTILSYELSHSYDKMVSLTQKHVRGRLVESLLMLASVYGFEADGKTINASLSRNDIAHLSNMTTSNAIRTLSNLASEGNIKVTGRKITILNYENLERISEQA
jgi:CRP/FNR family transcriptional regulator, polysaccharide utilization system transcription regulator